MKLQNWLSVICLKTNTSCRHFFLNHQTSQTLGKNPSTHQNIYKCYFKNKFSLNRRPVSVLCSGILVLLHPSIFLVPAQDWNCFSELVGFERFWASLLSVLPFWWFFFCPFFFEKMGSLVLVCGVFLFISGQFLLQSNEWVWRWWWRADKLQCRDVKQVNKLLICNLAFIWDQCKPYYKAVLNVGWS